MKRKINLTYPGTALCLTVALISGCGSSPKPETLVNISVGSPAQTPVPPQGHPTAQQPTELSALEFKQSDFDLKRNGGLLYFTLEDRVSPVQLENRQMLKVEAVNPEALHFQTVSATIESYCLVPGTRYRFRDLSHATTVVQHGNQVLVQIPTEALLHAMRDIESEQGMTECQDLFHKLTMSFRDTQLPDSDDLAEMMVIDFDHLPKN